MTCDVPVGRRAIDPAAVAIAAGTTLGWYAVPDVVRPRWGRALAKTAVTLAGAVLTVRATAEGREAREAVRSVREALRAGETSGDATADDTGTTGTTGTTADEPDATGAAADGSPPGVPPVLLALGGAGAVAVSVALALAGERWVYRRGERLRARGLRLPHTRVGIAMAVVAVALTAAEPYLRRGDGDETTD